MRSSGSHSRAGPGFGSRPTFIVPIQYESRARPCYLFTGTGHGLAWTPTSSLGASAWQNWVTSFSPLMPSRGERAIDPGPGTYHGGLIGASLLPLGTPLMGLQVNDNRRAVDYLVSRPDVDPARIAITAPREEATRHFTQVPLTNACGPSSLFAAWELTTPISPTACCVCEINLGGALYATTADLLAMVAPRASW